MFGKIIRYSQYEDMLFGIEYCKLKVYVMAIIKMKIFAFGIIWIILYIFNMQYVNSTTEIRYS